jgi:hypothetical protein
LREFASFAGSQVGVRRGERLATFVFIRLPRRSRDIHIKAWGSALEL